MKAAVPRICPAHFSGTVATEIARINRRGGDKSVWMEIDRWTQGGDGLPNGCRYLEWAAVVDQAVTDLNGSVGHMLEQNRPQKAIDAAIDHHCDLKELHRALVYLADIERRVKAFVG